MNELVVQESTGGDAIANGSITISLQTRSIASDSVAQGLQNVPVAEPDMAFTLTAEWAMLRAVFPPFDLVRAFVSRLMIDRPVRVRIETLSGASMELARIAAALEFDVALRLPAVDRLVLDEARALRWFEGCLHLEKCFWSSENAADDAALRKLIPTWPACRGSSSLSLRDGVSSRSSAFGYEAYAFGQRDQALLLEMQKGFIRHFEGCRKVLDVGCGTGVFLELLARSGYTASGVERNRMSAHYARSLGHDVVEEDALSYLETHPSSCDGLYCSHFIEHLPIEAAERLIKAAAIALQPGGVAVFVFPDPESIRSQLLGFWRDPEHVRFYHPELVIALAQINGFDLEFDSQRAAGRRVVPFGMEPFLETPQKQQKSGYLMRFLKRIGLAMGSELEYERRRTNALEAAVRHLWAVNQTWAWDDNAVLRFKKRP